jgi:hypothetical protein
VLTVPDEFSLMVGDALNNLRSSLDYIMQGLCPKASKFPIRKVRKELDDALNKGRITKTDASQELRDFILDTIQPYEGGNAEALVHLQELNNTDKHQLLIAKTQLTYVDGIAGEDENGIPFATLPWLIVHPYVASHPIKGRRGCKITDKGKATYRLVFGNDMPMKGYEITVALPFISLVVKDVLAVFETQVRCGLR